MPDDRTAVYRAYGAAGELLYVGIAGNWGRRWAQHSERSQFYAEVAKLEIEWFTSREEALDRESQQIRTEKPKFNIRGGESRPERRRDQDASGPHSIGPHVICDVCHREPAYSFAWIPNRDASGRWLADESGSWRLTGYCTADDEKYYVLFHGQRHEGFFDSEDERRDWIHHLRGKGWFDEGDFMAAVARATAS